MTQRQFQTIFKETSVLEFWCEVSKDYLSLGLCSLGLATIWITTLVQKTFSAKALIKTRQRNCLQLEWDFILTIRSVPPRIQKMMLSEYFITHFILIF
jgi:hypothetical protein